jgi:hypothetical protein
MKNIKFTGQITTVSPFSVKLPGQIGIPKNSHGAYFIPASSFRGMLRSTALHAICQTLDTVDVELPVDAIYMNGNGADTGRKVQLKNNGTETIAKNIQSREINPQISSFGNFAMAGKLKMGNAYCDLGVNPITRYGNGSRNHPFNRNSNLLKFVKADEAEYLKDVMKADALASLETSDLKNQKTKIENLIKLADAEEKKTLFAEKDEIEQKIKSVKEARVGSSETILRTLDGFDAIDCGHQLNHRFSLSNPSDTELQFLLWVLYKASASFRIGGHQNIGCGDISAHWEITETSFEDPMPKKIGTLTINDDGFQITGIEFNPKQIDDAIKNKTFDFTVY